MRARVVLILGVLSILGGYATRAEQPPPVIPEIKALDAKPTEPKDSDTSISNDEIVVVIAGQPIRGFPVFPATETEFRLKLAETGDVLHLHWTELQENERRRVQKLYGLKVSDGRLVFGEKVTCTRFHLRSKKVVEGLRTPERDRHGYLALKTSGSPLIEIPESEIESKEEFDANESDVYSAKEFYNNLILANPPGDKDAVKHLEYAKKAANLGLYQEALDRLQSAIIIDPQMADRVKDFQAQVNTDFAKHQVEDLYMRLVSAVRGQDYGNARTYMEQLDRNFPNSEYHSRWEALRPQVEEGAKTTMAKQVIQMAYNVASDLLQQHLYKKVRVDIKGNVVPSIPGKQVTTKNGHVFRGTVVDPGTNGEMVMKIGETTLTIEGKQIVMVQDIDLSEAASEVPPSLDDLKNYITDVGDPNGLKTQMFAKIAQTLKIPEAKVKEFFENRLSREAHYDGQYKISPIYATPHEAFYDKGSWLREGSKPAPLIQNPNDPNANAQSFSLRRRGNRFVYQKEDVKDPQEDPELTDDPVVWWKYQTNETRLSVLKGMMAEKVFTVKHVTDVRCPTCSGTGMIGVMGPSGDSQPQRCPNCRGIAKLFKIEYQ